MALETERATRLRERTEDLVSLQVLGVQRRSVPRHFPVWYSGIIGEDLPYHIVWKLSESSGLRLNGCKCRAQYLTSADEGYPAYAEVISWQRSRPSWRVQTF